MSYRLVSDLIILAKPGIVIGNSIAVIAGYGIAVLSGASFSGLAFAAIVIATALIMASSCVANNLIDQDIDGSMSRTRTRPLVAGRVTTVVAVLYMVALLLLGAFLGLVISTLVVIVGLAGWLLYAVVYTYLKRRSYHATLVGSLPGALPPVIGYIGADGQSISIILSIFGTLVAWQMVHFYAIAIFRKNEYKMAKVPVISLVRGVDTTRRHISYWYILSALALLSTVAVIPSFWYRIFTLAVWTWWIIGLPITPPGDDNSKKVFIKSLHFLALWTAAIWLAVLFEAVTP